MDYPIKVDYQSTNNAYKAKKWLDDVPELFAADFEVASKFTLKDKELTKYRLDNQNLSFEQKRVLLQQLTSDGLSHPSLTYITHLSVAWSERDSIVIICDSASIRKLVYNFLVSTNKMQLWHNAVFDFKHIFYNTQLLPKNYIDTQLLSKCLLNDASAIRDSTKLKELMAYAYGDWALSKDTFTLENMYEENTLRYSATDATACFKLYEDIKGDLEKWKI